MPLQFLLLEKVVNLEVGLVGHLGVLMEGQMVADLMDRLFLDDLVEDLAVYFPVSQEEDLMVGR